ncbi:DNA polymerase III subunit epsilon [Methylobacterium durans]|uniref:3'-5' exonuclease n=1 Tax=Methylobacterium durans TaxID=2202825 RepID=UPI002AFFEA8A|nr:exonuclease domain-containing protein [Methylobacterium durans]MEA1830846.1 DNA polymerase III subunit epsilon [Methylobacterium durans]
MSGRRDGAISTGMLPDTPIIRVVDLETTGARAGSDGVVEIGWQDVERIGGAWRIGAERGARYVDPERPIPARTQAVHHILDADVAGAPNWLSVAPGVLDPPGRPLMALAAHRAAFERRWCRDALTGRRPWICTYKCALRLWPDEPSHANQALRYARNPEGLDRRAGLPAHRAGPDAYVTAHLLREMLREAPVEALLAWTREPALLPRVTFGEHRGRRWDTMSDAFLADVLRRGGFDADIRYTARHEQSVRALRPDPAGPPSLLL